MVVAIPLFKGRVAPRFDYSENFLIVNIKNGKIESQQEINTSKGSPFGTIKELINRNVDSIICSGINEFSAQQLGFHNIRVFSWVTGEVQEILHQFLNRNLQPGYVPRYRQPQRRRFRGGRNFPWGI